MQTQRFSYQREQIYTAVRSTAEHPTAEMIYNRLKPGLPRLSLGTVYRNLQQMAREGRILELPGPISRFDAVTEPHTHFCCTQCGAVSDLAIPYDAALDRRVSSSGCRVENHSLIFYGICPACAEKQDACSNASNKIKSNSGTAGDKF